MCLGVVFSHACTQKDECTQWESAEQLAGTYMKQVEDGRDTMKALSAGSSLSSAWVDLN